MIEDVFSYTYGEEGPDPKLAASCFGGADPILHTSARTHFRNSVTVKDADRNFFRSIDPLPRRQEDVVEACDEAYQRIGLVRNIFDLMSDFTVQGIQICHRSISKEKRYRHWWEKVRATERSERFVNLLLRHGVTVVKRQFASIGVGKKIPTQYTFLNPATIDAIGGELATFVGKQRYGLKIPRSLLSTIKNPRTPEEKSLVADLPDYIKKAIDSGNQIIPLDPDNVSLYFYKKDDWNQWGVPILLSILPDLTLYQKNKIADMAALDRAASYIRLWRLGLPDHRIQPGPAAFKKLHDQLEANVEGGPMDLIWDAALDLTETNTDVYHFLGSEKYEPALQAIYAGLGIPQSLTGSGNDKQGFTNNALSLKTLIERLQYCRDVLMEFLDRECFMIQKAFGDRHPAKIKFDHTTFNDESAEKMLWLHLADRDIVSTQTIQEKFGVIPEVERERIRTEYRHREAENMPPKTSPYHDAQPSHQMAKIALQQGTISPTEAGVKKKPREEGDTSLLEHNAQKDVGTSTPDDTENRGVPGQGRPPGKKDSGPRKSRTPKVRVAMQMWAKDALRRAGELVVPEYLEGCGKKDVRSLTAVEVNVLEIRKAQILWNTEPFADLNVGGNSDENPVPLLELASELMEESGLNDTIDNRREMYAAAYALLKLGDE